MRKLSPYRRSGFEPRSLLPRPLGQPSHVQWGMFPLPRKGSAQTPVKQLKPQTPWQEESEFDGGANSPVDMRRHSDGCKTEALIQTATKACGGRKRGQGGAGLDPRGEAGTEPLLGKLSLGLVSASAQAISPDSRVKPLNCASQVLLPTGYVDPDTRSG